MAVLVYEISNSGTRHPGIGYQEWEKPLREYLPDYSRYGRYATFRRNTQIVRDASTVIAFPSPDSKGNNHSIKEARRLGRHTIVIGIPSNIS